MPRITLALLSAGSILLALAAGDAMIRLRDQGTFAVMVDHSASTRTAAYRDAAILQRRISELIGSRPYRIVEFSSESAERTEFIPPGNADAILLFSDARFAMPAALQPTFIAIDPNLENPVDAAVVRLEAHAGMSVVATVRNNGDTRKLSVTGDNRPPTTIPSTRELQNVVIESTAGQPIESRLSAGDAWPENDSLTLHPLVPTAQRWWVGAAPPDLSSGWVVVNPGALPSETSNYLAPGVIVLNNIAADALSAGQQARLSQFVRDLGGGIVLLGGNRAFAAGDYVGSAIESVSPLASSPENPQREWIILVDSSGSMATPGVDGITRWQHASESAVRILPHLPPHDTVHIGSFARDLRIWTPAAPAGEIAKVSLPPRDVMPQGPTNLDAILQSIALELHLGTRTEIIIISDADAAIADPDSLAARYRDVSSRIHLLAIGKESNTSLWNLSILTAGKYAAQPDAAQWATALRELFLGTLSDRMGAFPLNITFEKDLRSLSPRPTSVWNRTWLKDRATLLATGDDAGSPAPLAAKWQFGVGQVVAAAFPATFQEANLMSHLVLKKPRDPRFSVSWQSGPKLTVFVSAADAQRQLNDLDISLVTTDPGDPTRNVNVSKLVQTAPGEYESSVPAPRSTVLATIRTNDQVIDRFAVAGRYAPEFDEIGNDHAAMTELARLSGGAVIDVGQVTSINLPKTQRSFSLMAVLAVFGAGSIGLGLVWWKARG